MHLDTDQSVRPGARRRLRRLAPGAAPRLLSGAALALALAVPTACDRAGSGVPPEGAPSDEPVMSVEHAPADGAEPGRAAPSAPSVDGDPGAASPSARRPAAAAPRDRLAVPGQAVLMDPAATPYHLNPVRWTYLSRQEVENGEPREIRVHITTTAEREPVADGAGLALSLVTEMDARPPEGSGAGASSDWVSIGYQARIALLDERGLTISEPNPSVEGLQAQPSDWRVVLEGSPPTWPLPGAEGCTGSPGAFRLPIGTVGGVLVDCPDFTAHIGQAHVRTLWIDQVGFAYRELRVPTETGERVYTDYLLGSDVAELAPPAPEGVEVVELMP